MGFVSDLFSSDKGAGFQAKDATNIIQPTTSDQAQTAYNQAQGGISQQQAFLNALSGQNGIQNQSNVYNQLAGIAAGNGPNPAQAALAQATGQNTANQAALMASQRGAGANPALIARLAAQQGANTQQQAAGQAATLQAQQQLGAINAMGGIAGQQVANQASATQGYNQAVQSEQQNLLNAIQGQNAANVQMQANKNNANAQIANTNAQGQQSMFGGLLSGAGGFLGLAHGGKIPGYAGGGEIDSSVGGPTSNVGKQFKLYDSAPSQTGNGFQDQMSEMGGSSSGAQALNQGASDVGNGAAKGISNLFSSSSAGGAGGGSMGAAAGVGGGMGGSMPMMAEFAKGGKVPAMLSPGEKYLSPKDAKEVAEGKASPMQKGKKIPGKAKVKGDSEKNDIIPASLSPGGVVIPRSVMQSEDPAKAAAEFVSAVLAKQNLKRK